MDASIIRNAGFAEANREDWLALVAKALGEKSFDGVMISRSDDGLAIEALRERARNRPAIGRAGDQPGWRVIQRVDDRDTARAAQQAQNDMDNGADGVSIVFEGAPNAFGLGIPATKDALSAVLEALPLGRTHLRVDVHPASRATVDWLVEILTRRRVDPAKLSLSCGIDPAALFAGTGRLRMSIEALEASLPQSLAHYFAMGLPGVLIEADGRVYHNAGATEAQELGGMLASAVSYLRMFEEARQPLVYAAPHIGFSLSVDQDQFMSMAKIRALRILWARVQEACSIEASPCAIHAETSYRMMTLKDPETNILRSTIAAFAAAAGGADSIAVLPHTIAHGLPDGFARRIARNTQLILQHESHAGFVTDPGAGSGSIETLTDELCASAWEEFQRIEVEGGVLASLAAGHIQDRVEAAAARRAELYRSGERAIIGTTLFPAAEERPVKVLDGKRDAPVEDGAASCRPLPPRRIDEAIEARA